MELLSELDIYRQSFIQNAAGLGFTKDTKFEKLNEVDLVKGYCNALDNKDDIKINQYYSALMLRYWYKIYKYKESCKFTRLDDVEYIMWLSEAFDIAFKYRSWEDKNKGISKDPKSVDKVINRCCFSVRGLHFQHLNKDKRKLNFLCNSIEENTEEFGDASDYALSYTENNVSLVDDLIFNYINDNDLIKAIVVDNIAYQNSFKETKKINYITDIDLETGKPMLDKNGKELKLKYTDYKFNFDKRKLAKNLKNLNEKYFNYFKNRYLYEDNLEKFEEIKNLFLNKLSTNKLYNYIEETLKDVSIKLKGNI